MRIIPRPACLLLLALALAVAAPAPARNLQVSVLPVDLASDDRAVAGQARELIQARLQDAFFREGGYGIVERSDPAILGLILSELRFQNGGMVAPQEARQLGKLAGIEAFVVTRADLSVRMFGSVLSLQVRLIDVQSSRLLGLFQVRARGRARLDPGRSVAEAVASAMASLAAQLHAFQPPPADSR